MSESLKIDCACGFSTGWWRWKAMAQWIADSHAKRCDQSELPVVGEASDGE